MAERAGRLETNLQRDLSNRERPHRQASERRQHPGRVQIGMRSHRQLALEPSPQRSFGQSRCFGDITDSNRAADSTMYKPRRSLQLLGLRHREPKWQRDPLTPLQRQHAERRKIRSRQRIMGIAVVIPAHRMQQQLFAERRDREHPTVPRRSSKHRRSQIHRTQSHPTLTQYPMRRSGGQKRGTMRGKHPARAAHFQVQKSMNRVQDLVATVLVPI